MILTDTDKTALFALAGLQCTNIIGMDWGLDTRGKGWDGQKYKLLLMVVTARLLERTLESTCKRVGFEEVTVMADELIKMKGESEEDDE